MATTETTNPLVFKITEDMVITPTFTPNVRTGYKIFKPPLGKNQLFEFTVPAHITKLWVRACRWDGYPDYYREDERGLLSSGIRNGPVSGYGIRNADSGVHWNNYYKSDYVAVTPKKTYRLNVWNSGYKSRTYQFRIDWSPEINSKTADKSDL